MWEDFVCDGAGNRRCFRSEDSGIVSDEPDGAGFLVWGGAGDALFFGGADCFVCGVFLLGESEGE